MTTKVWHVKGQDPIFAYRAFNDKPDSYVYYQNRIAFDSPLARIPAQVFWKVIDHHSSGKYECSEIEKLEAQYQISQIRGYESLRELFPKCTIAAGMQY